VQGEVKRKLSHRILAAVRAQFGRPTGFWGRGAGFLMAHRSSNRRRNAWAVSLLDVQPDDRVLEIGFGPGLAIRQLSRIAQQGYVCGIDHSELMLRQARRRNADGIARGVVDLRLGSVDALPAFDVAFDKVLAVNAIMFWAETDARLAELRRLLRPGGVIAVAHQPRGPGASDETSAAAGREIAAALVRAGFSDVRVETLRLKPAVVCALGERERGAAGQSDHALPMQTPGKAGRSSSEAGIVAGSPRRIPAVSRCRALGGRPPRSAPGRAPRSSSPRPRPRTGW
jgi:SAM-dependent methyltransferase